jgi:hypothetical protein
MLYMLEAPYQQPILSAYRLVRLCDACFLSSFLSSDWHSWIF